MNQRTETVRPLISTGLRFDRPFYVILLVVFFGIVASGMIWFVADDMLNIAQDGLAHPLAQVHGAFAFASLLVLGPIAAQHVRWGWRARRNRLAGAVALVAAAGLILTAYGLYYASEAWHVPMVWLHIGIGFAGTVIMPVHVWIGRRSSQRMHVA